MITANEAAALIAPIAEDLNRLPTMAVYLRLFAIGVLLRSSELSVEEALSELDRLAWMIGRTGPEVAVGPLERAADAIRFASLPTDGPGAVLVPIVRAAGEQKLTGIRAAIERIARRIADGRMTKERAWAGLAALSEGANDGSDRPAVRLLVMARRALEH